MLKKYLLNLKTRYKKYRGGNGVETVFLLTWPSQIFRQVWLLPGPALVHSPILPMPVPVVSQSHHQESRSSVHISKLLLPVRLPYFLLQPARASPRGQLDAQRDGCRDSGSPRPALPISHTLWIQLPNFCCSHSRGEGEGRKMPSYQESREWGWRGKEMSAVKVDNSSAVLNT